MFLSTQTYEGLKISIYFHIEGIQFLLAQGYQYVLSERFMQDVIEETTLGTNEQKVDGQITGQPSNLVIMTSLSQHKGILHQLYVVMLAVVMGKRSGTKSVTNQCIKERKRSDYPYI
jgi:hypothetical protein